jgi:hypothetical protein
LGENARTGDDFDAGAAPPRKRPCVVAAAAAATTALLRKQPRARPPAVVARPRAAAALLCNRRHPRPACGDDNDNDDKTSECLKDYFADGYACTACVAHRSPSTGSGLFGRRFISPKPSALCGALVPRGFEMKLNIKLFN